MDFRYADDLEEEKQFAAETLGTIKTLFTFFDF